MYYYILDAQHIDPIKFERQQIELQGLLAEFKISGEMTRVTSLRTIEDLVETASERGATTLVACGTDDTFNLMLAHLQGRNFTLAFVPFDPDSYLSRILGVDSLQTAAKTIAARRIEKIDLAIIANHYFISYLEFGLASAQVKNLSFWNSFKTLSLKESKLKVRIDNSYTMDIKCLGGLVVNTRSVDCGPSPIASPTDGFLDLLVLGSINRFQVVKYKQEIADGCLEKIPGTTVIKCRRIDILEPFGFPLHLANRVITKVPATVEIVPKTLRMIVGKNRTF